MENSEQLRILIVDGKLICGGVESFLMNIYRHLDRSKIQFDFLVHYKERFFYDDEVEKLGGKIYRLSFRNDKNLLKYQKDLKNFFIKHKEYQIVWGHMDGLASIYLKIAKECGVNTTICHSHITSPENSLKGFIKMLLKCSTYKYCDFRFACSTEAGKYLYGNHDFNLIPNAIETEKFSFNKEAREKIRKANGWESKIVIGHIGRFFAQKNHNYLIKIFERVSKDEQFVLCLCGDGEERENIQKLVIKKGLSSRVTFTGNISNTNEYYQAFDIFVMPSLYEGLPVTGIEAQTSGLKCIFADTITPEVNLVKDNVYFIPIGYENIDKWTSCIENIKDYVRRDCSEIIAQSGYSITKLANWIADFMEKDKNEKFKIINKQK